ncbi:MAG: adk-B [Chlamydiales bacterium]|jgi:adenylate kinase|nr:adk-B [Chlamydiales bacterium]
MVQNLNLSELLDYRKKFPCILLFGAPGSGKGTLGKSLAQLTGHYHLSSGDIFRGIPSSSAIGQFCQSYSQQGLLVPDDAVITIWKHYVSGLVATNRYLPEKQMLLLDGLPRTENQISLLEPYAEIKAIVVLDISNEDELVKRLQKRAKEEGRKDDIDTNVLRTRFRVYNEDTAKVLKNYPENLVYKINALQHPLYVVRDVLQTLSAKLAI